MAADPCDVYFDMHSAWLTKIPKRLQGMKPRTLIGLLELAGSGGGISQSTAAATLGLTQWGVSKISRKLISEGWLSVVRKPKPHQREKLMIITTRAKVAIDALRSELSNSFGANPSSKRPPTAARPREVLPIQHEMPGATFSLTAKPRTRLR